MKKVARKATIGYPVDSVGAIAGSLELSHDFPRKASSEKPATHVSAV